MSKQTAVEWLVKIYLQKGKIDSFDIEQAKAMEKEQMKEAALRDVTRIPAFIKLFEEQFEKYYNQTYKGGEQ